MRHWQLYQVALLWLGASILTLALVALDVWRVGEFAIAIPGRPSLWRIGAILKAAAPVLPVATLALIAGPLGIIGCTLWWLFAHVHRH